MFLLLAGGPELFHALGLGFALSGGAGGAFSGRWWRRCCNRGALGWAAAAFGWTSKRLNCPIQSVAFLDQELEDVLGRHETEIVACWVKWKQIRSSARGWQNRGPRTRILREAGDTDFSLEFTGFNEFAERADRSCGRWGHSTGCHLFVHVAADRRSQAPFMGNNPSRAPEIPADQRYGRFASS